MDRYTTIRGALALPTRAATPSSAPRSTACLPGPPSEMRRPLGWSAPAAKAPRDLPQADALAREAGCDAVHPRYAVLSENARVAPRPGRRERSVGTRATVPFRGWPSSRRSS